MKIYCMLFVNALLNAMLVLNAQERIKRTSPRLCRDEVQLPFVPQGVAANKCDATEV